MTASDDVTLLEHGDVAALESRMWLERLLASVEAPVQDGRRYPGFPDESTQKAFVGSAYADALEEGFRFYEHVLEQMRAHRLPPRGGYLDFGAGWGRIGRFFLRDFESADMCAVDIDPGMVAFCREAAVPGRHMVIENGRPLPFKTGAFRLVTAYSVFTHLPEVLFRAWMRELLRVLAPGGLLVFTVEPERFLDFVAAIDVAQPESGWHAALAANLGPIEGRRRELGRTGFTYLPTGGGPWRPVDVYGDAVVTPDFVRRAAGVGGKLVDYLDDSNRFWQAVAVVRRNRWPLGRGRGGLA